jgi:histidyl-tRNA synthetase
MIQRPRGTQDILDMTLFQETTQAIRTFLVRAGFAQIETPIFESIDLFKRSLGIHTDIVSKEMFTLQPRTEEQEIFCLRPELTASIARAFIEHNVQHLPWNVFSLGPVFRYERPQKGRFRQFHQISIESIGSRSIGYDAHLLGFLHHLFTTVVPVGPYELHLNFLGCVADRAAYKTVLQQFLKDHPEKICSTCVQRADTNTLRVFDCKTPSCQQFYKTAPVLIDHLCAECTQEWQELQQYLNRVRVPFVLMPHLVRGLDYYNKTAFEFVSDQLGAQSSFCAGGRYDQLLEQLSLKHAHPALGAGIGIERLLMLHAQHKIHKTDVVTLSIGCIPLETQYIPELMHVAQRIMQETEANVQLLLDGSLKSNMKKADKFRLTHALLIGQEEAESKKITLKNMQNGIQTTMAIEECLQKIKNTEL